MRSIPAPVRVLTYLVRYALIVVTAAAHPADTSARDEQVADWWLGLHGGAVWSSHSDVPLWWPASGGSVGADGIGWVAGIDATIRLRPGIYLAPVLAYESWLATSEHPFDVELDGDDTIGRHASVIVHDEIDYATVRQAMVFGVVLFGSEEATCLAIEFGPSSALVVVGDMRRRMRLDPPEPGRFANPAGYPVSNDGRTIVLYDGEIPERVGMRIGLLGGLRAWHRFGHGLDGWAALRYDLALTNVDTGRWRASAVLLTAGVQLDI